MLDLFALTRMKCLAVLCLFVATLAGWPCAAESSFPCDYTLCNFSLPEKFKSYGGDKCPFLRAEYLCLNVTLRQCTSNSDREKIEQLLSEKTAALKLKHCHRVTYSAACPDVMCWKVKVQYLFANNQTFCKNMPKMLKCYDAFISNCTYPKEIAILESGVSELLLQKQVYCGDNISLAKNCQVERCEAYKSIELGNSSDTACSLINASVDCMKEVSSYCKDYFKMEPTIAQAKNQFCLEKNCDKKCARYKSIAPGDKSVTACSFLKSSVECLDRISDECMDYLRLEPDEAKSFYKRCTDVDIIRVYDWTEPASCRAIFSCLVDGNFGDASVFEYCISSISNRNCLEDNMLACPNKTKQQAARERLADLAFIQKACIERMKTSKCSFNDYYFCNGAIIEGPASQTACKNSQGFIQCYNETVCELKQRESTLRRMEAMADNFCPSKSGFLHPSILSVAMAVLLAYLGYE